MSIPQPSKLRAGFTLVELLIVVIILAILAAIVIPQFSSATRDTQESALDANLAGMRNAIELYKVQHAAWPGAAATNGGDAECTTAGGTLGDAAATAGSKEAVIEHLTMYSDKVGKTCTVQTAKFRFGPYIRKALPVNPVTDTNVLVMYTTAVHAPAGAAGGWAYNSATGQMVVDSNALDSKGQAYHLR